MNERFRVKGQRKNGSWYRFKTADEAQARRVYNQRLQSGAFATLSLIVKWEPEEGDATKRKTLKEWEAD